jgi:hypothetical protein
MRSVIYNPKSGGFVLVLVLGAGTLDFGLWPLDWPPSLRQRQTFAFIRVYQSAAAGSVVKFLWCCMIFPLPQISEDSRNSCPVPSGFKFLPPSFSCDLYYYPSKCTQAAQIFLRPQNVHFLLLLILLLSFWFGSAALGFSWSTILHL